MSGEQGQLLQLLPGMVIGQKSPSFSIILYILVHENNSSTVGFDDALKRWYSTSRINCIEYNVKCDSSFPFLACFYGTFVVLRQFVVAREKQPMKLGGAQTRNIAHAHTSSTLETPEVN